MSKNISKYIFDPKFVHLFLFTLVAFGIIIWIVRQIYKKPITASHIIAKTPPQIPDVGQDGFKLIATDSSNTTFKKEKTDTSLNLPAFIPPQPTTIPEMRKDNLFNTMDNNIDPRIQMQWSIFEKQHQTNETSERNGQVWLKHWSNMGPLNPLTPKDGNFKPTPGPVDPQLAYGMAITAGLDAQASKFCVSENGEDITYMYKNNLQQIPGSHFQVDAASFNSYDTPQVIDRFSFLSEKAAAWVIMKLNEKIRKEHPCFSLSGREHFELSNPPLNCGDIANPKQNPITLIRVFECRVKKRKEDEAQLIYLTMEIANHISAGSGGMFNTIVTMDNKGNFVEYNTPERDEKQTFVLPRTRTNAN